MNQEIAKLYDVLFDNQEKSVHEIIVEVEKAVAKLLPYNHNEDNIKKACNIINVDKKNTSILNSENIDSFSKEVEALEGLFTKRECIYMLVGMRAKIEEVKKMEKFLDKLKGLVDD